MSARRLPVGDGLALVISHWQPTCCGNAEPLHVSFSKGFFLHKGWISEPDHSREIGQEASRGDGKSRAYRVRVNF